MEKQRQHRKNSAQLDHHFKHLIKAFADIQTNKLIEQYQMAGGGYRQPLGDAFHNAKKNGL